MDKYKNIIAIYNLIANDYTDKYFDPTPEDIPHLEKFLSMLPKGSHILDAACGPGGGVKFAIDRGHKAEGVDISWEMIKIAEQKVPTGNFKVMDINNLSYPDDTFDGLMANYSLIHVPNEEMNGVIKEFKRVLKIGGVMLILAIKGDGEQLVDEPLSPGNSTFLNLFSLARLASFVESTNFRIIEQNETNVVGIDGEVTQGLEIIAINK